MKSEALRPGLVVDPDGVAEIADRGGGAIEKPAIDRSFGSGRFAESVLRVWGRSDPRRHAGKETILFTVSGSGVLHLDGEARPLEPEMSAYVAPGREHVLESEGPGELVAVEVVADLTEAGPRDPALPVTVRYREQARVEHPTVKGRAFRVLLETPGLTQFVGEVPPGRANDHYHLYEEVAYILEGEGVLHMEGHEPTPFREGCCLHFPPLLPHCVENTGKGIVRVLGVFTPAGSPAEAYYPGTREPAT